MSLESFGRAVRGAAIGLALCSPVWSAPLDKTDDAKPKAEKGKSEEQARPAIAPTPRPIRLVANEVIKRALLAAPTDTAHRISVMGGLVGLGPYNPRGGADYGIKAPPRYLFPQAGAGNSLNVDPMTGRSYFTNMP